MYKEAPLGINRREMPGIDLQIVTIEYDTHLNGFAYYISLILHQ